MRQNDTKEGEGDGLHFRKDHAFCIEEYCRRGVVNDSQLGDGRAR